MPESLPDQSARANHRVVITFDDGCSLKLICPEQGCVPASVCSECYRNVDDDERNPCPACPDPESTECWVKSWFDNCTYDELLHGEITVEVECEWDGDHIDVEIVGSDDVDRLRAENEALKADRLIAKADAKALYVALFAVVRRPGDEGHDARIEAITLLEALVPDYGPNADGSGESDEKGGGHE